MAKVKYSFDEPAVGSDGEGFFVNKDNSAVPTVGLLGGTKGDPKRCDGGGYLEDCVGWEINPVPATASEGASVFVANIKACIEAVNIRANELDLSVDIRPSILFTAEDLDSDQARVSGCSPAYNAWAMSENRPVDLSTTNLRFASGDLHLSWPDIGATGRYERVNMIRCLDATMSMAEILCVEEDDRNAWYGKTGTHRPTNYGVEYKVLSNFWMLSDERMEWAFNSAISVINHVLHMDNSTRIYESYGSHCSRARENWDKTLAQSVLESITADNGSRLVKEVS